jgi:hypothetical protein
MPEENLPQPTDASTTPPVTQAEGQRESGSKPGATANLPLNPMPPVSSPTQLPDDSPERLPFWLRQSERFLRVIVRMYLGLLVCCAPWYPPAWDANPLFSSPAWLHSFITYGAVRGLVSGLGLLNLWIALRDALRGPAETGQQ